MLLSVTETQAHDSWVSDDVTANGEALHVDALPIVMSRENMGECIIDRIYAILPHNPVAIGVRTFSISNHYGGNIMLINQGIAILRQYFGDNADELISNVDILLECVFDTITNPYTGYAYDDMASVVSDELAVFHSMFLNTDKLSPIGFTDRYTNLALADLLADTYVNNWQSFADECESLLSPVQGAYRDIAIDRITRQSIDDPTRLRMQVGRARMVTPRKLEADIVSTYDMENIKYLSTLFTLGINELRYKSILQECNGAFSGCYLDIHGNIRQVDLSLAKQLDIILMQWANHLKSIFGSLQNLPKSYELYISNGSDVVFKAGDYSEKLNMGIALMFNQSLIQN